MSPNALKTKNIIVNAGSGSTPTLGPHTNSGLEIVYVERGHLHWQVEGREELVPPRSVFFTLPWQRHGSTRDFEPGHRWHFVIVRVDKRGDLHRPGPITFPRELGLDDNLTQRMTRVFRSTHRHAYPASSLLAEMLPRMVRECHTAPSPAREAVLAKLTALTLLELHAIIGRAQALREQGSDSSDQRVAELIEQVSLRCDESWTLDAMVKITGLGRTRLAQVLREQTGDTPLRLVNRLRIARARRMLTDEPGQSVMQIALACGYATSQHFAEVFRQFTGFSPREFRMGRE